MSFRRAHRLSGLAGIAFVVSALWAAVPATPAFAAGTLDGDGPNGTCSKYLGDIDCWHYVGTFKTAKACHARGGRLTNLSEAAAGVPTHACPPVPPNGYRELYVWDSACRSDVPFDECRRPR